MAGILSPPLDSNVDRELVAPLHGLLENPGDESDTVLVRCGIHGYCWIPILSIHILMTWAACQHRSSLSQSMTKLVLLWRWSGGHMSASTSDIYRRASLFPAAVETRVLYKAKFE